MAYNLEGNNPLRQFQDTQSLAPSKYIEIMLGLAHGIVDRAPYQLEYEYEFDELSGNDTVTFTAIEKHDGDTVNQAASICVAGQSFGWASGLYLSYAADNSLVIISPQNKHGRLLAAKLAEPVVDELIESRFLDAGEEEMTVLRGLAVVTEGIRRRRRIEGYQPHPDTSIFETVKKVSGILGVAAARRAFVKHDLEDHFSLTIRRLDYANYELPEDFEPDRRIRLITGLEDLLKKTTSNIFEFHDGTVFTDSFGWGEDGVGFDDDEVRIRTELRDSGLYMPMRDEVEKITNALVEFSSKDISGVPTDLV